MKIFKYIINIYIFIFSTLLTQIIKQNSHNVYNEISHKMVSKTDKLKDAGIKKRFNHIWFERDFFRRAVNMLSTCNNLFSQNIH